MPSGSRRRRVAFVHAVHQEHALAETGKNLFDLLSVEVAAGFTGRAFQSVHQAVLVALGLQPADEPGPAVRRAFVVEIDGVLRREHDAYAEGARLFEQREQRLLRWRIRDRREVAEDLVHVEDGAQAGGAGLRARPASASFSSSETKNIRSVSLRCAIEMTAMRGLPSGVWSRLPMSSGSPSSHASKPGEARRLFRLMASSKRSLAGKNDSRSITPIRVTGGDWIWWMSAGEVEGLPLLPGVVEEGREQDVLAALHRIGVDAEQRAGRRWR